MNKVVVGCCPTTQGDISKDPCFASEEGQKQQQAKHEREMKVNNEGCDVQTAFIDNSATNFINSVFSSSNNEENNIHR